MHHGTQPCKPNQQHSLHVSCQKEMIEINRWNEANISKHNRSSIINIS